MAIGRPAQSMLLLVCAAALLAEVEGETARGAATSPTRAAAPHNLRQQIAGGWTDSPRNFQDTKLVYTCARDGKSFGAPFSVWGTDIYTDDSSVCTAAVFEGRITLAAGGTVTIEIRPGQQSYAGSTRNGITTKSWGSWDASFVIVSATPGGGKGPPPTGSATGTVTVDGQPFVGGVIAYGSTVDVTAGTLTLNADVGQVTVHGEGGVTSLFKIARPNASHLDLDLVGGSFTACGRALADADRKKKKKVRLLWAKGNGKFRSKGRDSIASVHGTEWLTEDRCDGTLTVVKEGVVSLRDLRRRKTVAVTAGHSYLALHRP